MAVALDEPLAVVAVLEGQQDQAQVLERGEGLDPEELLLEGADEALGAAVGFSRQLHLIPTERDGFRSPTRSIPWLVSGSSS